MSRIAPVQLTTAKGVAGDKLRLDSWIEVQLIGEDDRPIAGERVRVELPGGALVDATLDDGGLLRLDGVPPGMCRISFPDLDREAWSPLLPAGDGDAASAPASDGVATPERAA